MISLHQCPTPIKLQIAHGIKWSYTLNIYDNHDQMQSMMQNIHWVEVARTFMVHNPPYGFNGLGPWNQMTSILIEWKFIS